MKPELSGQAAGKGATPVHVCCILGRVVPMVQGPGCSGGGSGSQGPLHQHQVLFLAHPRLIVHPRISKYVNTSGGGGRTRPACIHRGGGSERKTVFLDGFNEYRMFIVTIPCDLHKRLENSTSILAAPPQSTAKEEDGGEKKQICGATQQDCCALSLLQTQISIRQT